ncbi:MAG TPA: LysE family transporter [Dehalococcoidia bacterium]|nr:LysE family transporter [Dehalococcoidia bacterium]
MSLAALGAIFSTSFVVSLTGALAPGPVSTMAVREGVRRGFWAGPALAAGHGVVEALLVVGLALGLNELLDTDAVTASVALAGGLYLVYLGLLTVITAPKQELQLEAQGVPVGPTLALSQGASPEPTSGAFRTIPARVAAGLAFSGIALSVTNPFWVAWWATIGTAYIVEALDQGAVGVGTFYTAHFITDLGWLSLIAFLLARGRRLMSRAAYRAILGACGLFLVALGGWFLSSGLGYVV